MMYTTFMFLGFVSELVLALDTPYTEIVMPVGPRTAKFQWVLSKVSQYLSGVIPGPLFPLFGVSKYLSTYAWALDHEKIA